jgi:hypothetical protein
VGEKGPSGKITDDVVDISHLDCGTKFLAMSNSSPLSSSYLFPLLSLHSFLPTLHFFPPFRLVFLPHPPIIIAIPPFMSFCVLFLLLSHFFLLPLIFLYFPLLLPFLSPVFSHPSFSLFFPIIPSFPSFFPIIPSFLPLPFLPHLTGSVMAFPDISQN